MSFMFTDLARFNTWHKTVQAVLAQSGVSQASARFRDAFAWNGYENPICRDIKAGFRAEAPAHGVELQQRRSRLGNEGAHCMIFGTHIIVYSRDADADRAFFRDVLGLPSVDAGHGWLIFALPPAETAFHPADNGGRHELYFMCHDLQAEMKTLTAKGVRFSEVQEARWGSFTTFPLPGGGEVGLYQPKHPLAIQAR
jgi:catechol 2,3-dioxygenase-like lactoylglutathione lyase family enzyme